MQKTYIHMNKAWCIAFKYFRFSNKRYFDKQEQILQQLCFWMKLIQSWALDQSAEQDVMFKNVFFLFS